MVDVDEAIKFHLDRWLYLLGFDRVWSVTYEVSDGPVAPDRPIAINVYFRRRKSGKQEAHIAFDRGHIKSDRAAEVAALHEVLHLADWGLGNDAHKLIERLEKILVLTRKRASRLPKSLRA